MRGLPRLEGYFIDYGEESRNHGGEGRGGETGIVPGCAGFFDLNRVGEYYALSVVDNIDAKGRCHESDEN